MLLLIVVAWAFFFSTTETGVDTGIVSVEFADTKTPAHRNIKASLEESGVFQVAADSIDAVFLVPHELHIRFDDCGEITAFYNPEQTNIVVCYELVNHLIRDFGRYPSSDSVVAPAVHQTLLWVFYHELAHALIDMLDLPVTGREEDAADQLATLTLLRSGPDGSDGALASAKWFLFNSRHRKAREPLWGEHSLDKQRYYNILCWVYGSDTTEHLKLTGRKWGLPRGRAERCPAEYDRMSRSWDAILGQ